MKMAKYVNAPDILAALGRNDATAARKWLDRAGGRGAARLVGGPAGRRRAMVTGGSAVRPGD